MTELRHGFTDWVFWARVREVRCLVLRCDLFRSKRVLRLQHSLQQYIDDLSLA